MRFNLAGVLMVVGISLMMLSYPPHNMIPEALSAVGVFCVFTSCYTLTGGK